MQPASEFKFNQPQGVVLDSLRNLNAFVLKAFPKYFIVLPIIPRLSPFC